MAQEKFHRYAITEPERLALGPDSVPALLVRPRTAARCPAALVQHGYASSKADLLPLATQLASYGFVTLLPDAWGHGERFPTSGPTWMTELTCDYFVEVVRRSVTDLGTALDVLLADPGVRRDQVVVAGFSMGAMAALIVGTEDARVAGVISVSGASLPDMVHAIPFGARPPSAEAEQWALAHDAAGHIARLAPKPLLIQHGRVDDMVPVASALRLYERAQPYYAATPERLALMLYEHTHVATEPELHDAVEWIAPFFLRPEQPMAMTGS